MKRIYLDNNSTTPIDPAVAEAMAECYRAGYANPASQHESGRRARKRLEEAREGIGYLVGADLSSNDADQVVFTSGGTEANNLAIRGLAGQAAGNVVISAIEHPSVVGAAEHLRHRGFEIRRLRVSRNGVVDLDHLQEMIDASTRVVSIMLGNNETGVLQPVAEAARLCQQAGVPLHTDAVQVVGKLPVSFREVGVAALTLSAHKFHGPRGIGALILRPDVKLEPILFGGFQQAGLRPGTEPVDLAVGMYEALRMWAEQGDQRARQMCELRDRLEHLLSSQLDCCVINGAGAARLSHTSNISFLGLNRQALLMALDLAGVDCSTGSACASGSSEPSPVLLAMGCEKDVVEGSLRISLGAQTRREEIDEAATRIVLAVKKLRLEIPRRKSPAASRL